MTARGEIEACRCTRRSVLAIGALALLAPPVQAAAPAHQEFIDAAFKMRDEAVRAGDQAFGAVVVRGRRIIGFGPSRVIQRNDSTAHAEREAMRAAQARLGTKDLSGCLLYSSSRPCSACETAAAQAKIARMYYGRDAADGGAPRR
jgi:tRNA(Arg) A34 adenosine deaminase TadA